MCRSIRNFNPPPHIYSGHLTMHCARGWGGGGGFERCIGRVGNLNRIYLLCWRNMPVRFFSFFQGLMDLKDRISPLLVNNSFGRLFKRSLKVSLRHLSLWKACRVFDWRQNLSLRRVISVLIGGAFEWLFCPEGREFEQANLQTFKCLGGCPGGDVELSNWLPHKLATVKRLKADISNVSPSSEQDNCCDKGLMLETSAFNLFTVANLPYQLSS